MTVGAVGKLPAARRGVKPPARAIRKQAPPAAAAEPENRFASGATSERLRATLRDSGFMRRRAVLRSPDVRGAADAGPLTRASRGRLLRTIDSGRGIAFEPRPALVLGAC